MVGAIKSIHSEYYSAAEQYSIFDLLLGIMEEKKIFDI
jgi:hypothetical protein